MDPRVFISVRPGWLRAALVEDGELTELLIYEAGRESLVGNIYLGRVEKVVGHLAAAFVDIGLGATGFLAAAEASKPGVVAEISSCVSEGQALLVQVQRDGFEAKGPKLTTRLALTGRAVVLLPGDEGLRLSRRIADKAERRRLEKLAAELAQPGEGFILRTAAGGLAAADLTREAEALRRTWADIQARAERGKPPAALWQTDPLIHILRDLVPPAVAAIVIDDAAALCRARAWCGEMAPGLAARLQPHRAAGSLFEAAAAGGEDSVEAAIEEALSPALALPSGGSVLFSETPALIAIDVNAGAAARGGAGQTALAVNFQAVELIARQIRLRNLSGLLVIDFITVKKKKDQDRVLQAMKKAVAGDPAGVFIGGFTRFGLLEMTRRRHRPSLASTLLRPCRRCHGQGRIAAPLRVAHQALDRLAREADAVPAVRLSLRVSRPVATALDGPAAAALKAVSQRFGRNFPVIPDDNLAADDFEVLSSGNDGGSNHER